MAYEKALPQPTPETQEFWDGLKRHELRVQQCQDCQRHYLYPRPFCPNCWSRNVEWTTVSGAGKLETYVINHRPARGFQDEAPYVIAVVTLDEGPRLHAGGDRLRRRHRRDHATQVPAGRRLSGKDRLDA